jgi:hypothetical protein
MQTVRGRGLGLFSSLVLILLVPTMSSDLAKELDATSNPRHELRQQPLTATSLPSLISVNPLQERRILEKPCQCRFAAE